jgi:hypothetical protein
MITDLDQLVTDCQRALGGDGPQTVLKGSAPERGVAGRPPFARRCPSTSNARRHSHLGGMPQAICVRTFGDVQDLVGRRKNRR